MREGSQKVERLKDGMFDDMTVAIAVKEIVAHNDMGLNAKSVRDWLNDTGFFVMSNGTKYTLLTLRWL